MAITLILNGRGDGGLVIGDPVKVVIGAAP